jgi:hypothetical protein
MCVLATRAGCHGTWQNGIRWQKLGANRTREVKMALLSAVVENDLSANPMLADTGKESTCHRDRRTERDGR